VTRAFARFLKVESATGVALLGATMFALLLANSPLAGATNDFWGTSVGIHVGGHDLTRSLRDWINDGLMTLFFFVVALELKRGLVEGELKSLRLAAFSLAGAIGGMLVPASIYWLAVDGPAAAHGWGMVMATDTAFVVGILVLVGSRAPASLRAFFIALAIFDDVGAIVVVAVGYGNALAWPYFGLAAAVAGLVFAAARAGVRAAAVYWLLGIAMWLALDRSGLHPTIAGVVLGLMTPARQWVNDARLRAIFERVLDFPGEQPRSSDAGGREDLRHASVAAREMLSPVEQLEQQIHPWVGFVVMPAFALANAGVAFTWAAAAAPVVIPTLLGLVIGKPLGILLFCWLAVSLGLATRPVGLRWSTIASGAVLTGIGFTMSLFIAELAFPPSALAGAKIGILTASTLSALFGLLALLRQRP
jgi:NhaA family Na+:H+ antiporter